jgi:hypothetical protein
VSTQLVVVLVAGIVVGWVLHMIWDAVLDWLYDAFGYASSVMWDVCAVLGILVVVGGVGFALVHYHAFSHGST